MQVTVSVCGKFHGFFLTQQLLKRGHLKRLITSYPKLEAVKSGIPTSKVSSILIKEFMEKGWSLFPDFLKHGYDLQYFILEIFDRYAASILPNSDLCVAWSGAGLHTIRRAKDLGAVTVIDEGSSHILFQQMILKEEYEKYGLRPQLAHPKIVDKEIQEYLEADYIAIPSFFVKRTFLEQGLAQEKLIHIPYGVDLNEFRLIPKEDKFFRIIYCGAITLRKGVHYLLEAFSQLNLPGAELWLIGGISKEMRPLINRYANKRVVYKGHYAQSELYKYYSQGSIFVIASIEDGFGMVIFQAMACGLPVICTTNTGGEDVIRDGRDGFIIPIRDVRALKEKILLLYENEEMRQNMARSVLERVKEFTWDRYGEKMIQAYQNILSYRR